MTSNHYIIDTSSLIGLQRNNPIDIFPSVWRSVESLIQRGLLVSPKEVLYEIVEKDDELATWSKRQNRCFKEPTQKQIEIIKEILKTYPSFVKMDSKHDADAWVVALAIEMNPGSQQIFEPMKRMVVTEEKSKGDRIKIPFVCQKFNIETLSILDMFRIEGWKF